jgi:hypothetical protein
VRVTPSRVDPIVLSLAMVTWLAGLVLFVRLGPPRTFWTIDDAGKSLVVANLLRHPTSTALDYPGQALDPYDRFFPQPIRGAERYATLRGEHIVSQYLAPFTYLALPFAALGFAGLGILPALGGAAVVLLTGLLATALAGTRRAGRAAAAIVVASSPLLFYSSVFWEHTLVVALAAGGFLALSTSRPRPFVSGLLLGACCLLREETGLLLSAVVLAGMLLRRREDAARVAGGGLLGVVARGVFHLVTSGSLLGVHGSLNQPAAFQNADDAARDLLVGAGFSGLPDLVVLGALVLLAAAAFLPRRAALPPLILGVAGLAVASIRGWQLFPGGEDAALALLKSNSAAMFVPWALAAPLLRLRPAAFPTIDAAAAPSPRARDAAGSRASASLWLGLSVLLFVIFFVLFVPSRSITGVHPGPRMLLPALPLVAAIAAARMDSSRIAAALLLPLLLAGALWNVRSLQLLHEKRMLSGDLAAAISARPERIVVTDLFWLPTDMASLWDTKDFYLVDSDRQWKAFVAAAAEAGETSILAANEPGRIPGTPIASIHRADLPAFSVDLQSLTLTPAASP